VTKILKLSEAAEVPEHRREILQKVKSRAIGCPSPNDWILREPVNTNRFIRLAPGEVTDNKPHLVLVKRLMYLIEYGFLPSKQITMVCGKRNCVNPAHMRVRGWESEAYKEIPRQIKRGILYQDDAEKWFQWESKE
jgi:hypothetical protein